jgi:tetratricopeptide (TPR) repeat protein
VGKRARQKKDAGRASSRPEATPDGLKPVLHLAICLGLVLAIFAIYGQCVSHPFLRLDDPDYVLDNEHVSSGLSASNVAWAMTAIHASNWHPLTWISHMVDVELFGLDAGKHILVSVALHALNTLLLFIVLHRATRAPWKSAAVAALFALHPLHVESVAWVAERKDVLSTLFFLITLYLWIGWVENRAQTRYWLAVAAFATGLMAKPMLVTTPFVLLLLDWWPFRRKIDREAVIEKWPFFALTFASILITLRAQRVAMGASPLALRIGNALLSYAGYLRKTFWPADLAIVYPFPDHLSPSAVAFAVILLIAITAAAFVYRKRAPFLLTGWLWYLGTLVPVIGIVQVGHEAMADRYTYIPLIGIFIAAAWLSERVIRSRAALASAATIVIAALAACTIHQLRYWRNGVVLFEHALQVSDNRHAREGLAHELMEIRDYARAADEFRAAMRDGAGDDHLHAGLGTALLQLADPAGARREFEAAVAANPRNALALRRLGDLALDEGRLDDARSLLQRSAAVNRDPSTLAVLALVRGNVAEAIALYRRAIEQHPNRPEIHSDLAAVLSRSGREAESVVEYEKALALDPHHYEAQMNLGAALTRLNRNDEAVAWFERAGKERPESAEPHIYLALMYARNKRNDDAIREASAALQINAASANLQFTNALRLPFNESNLAGWIEYLRKRPPGEPGGRR